MLAPGTAMTALSYCIDTVPKNFVEFLVEREFDVWLFDWRTSPELPAHEHQYSLDDVARYDWPAVIKLVHGETGKAASVLAHCLSAPTLFLALVRGYVPRDSVKAFVASQVALHLNFTSLGERKVALHLDKLLPRRNMIHQIEGDAKFSIGDVAASFLSKVIPTSFKCDNSACYRHAATFGEIIQHSRVDPETHKLMGPLVPRCIAAFLKDVAKQGRPDHILTDSDLQNLDRLKLPIHFVSGRENRMFVPSGTEASYHMLCAANGPDLYRRTVYDGFGHLDFFIGKGAAEEIWGDLAASLDR